MLLYMYMYTHTSATRVFGGGGGGGWDRRGVGIDHFTFYAIRVFIIMCTKDDTVPQQDTLLN